MIHLFTIGFTKKSAEEFFTLLREAGVRRILDIRLKNNTSLAGFTRQAHLPFFLKEICGADYKHIPECAPTSEILKAYKPPKKKKNEKGPLVKPISWDEYVQRFMPLIRERKIENILTPELLDYGCLLCSEPSPGKCHRRLVAEYMKGLIPEIEITHLQGEKKKSYRARGKPKC
jgi:uncharacterized protein (DUF488 family)